MSARSVEEADFVVEVPLKVQFAWVEVTGEDEEEGEETGH
jgi:hypothetical protein